MEQENIVVLLRVLSMAAHIVLENGGETYRADDVVSYIGPALGADSADIFTTPTGIMLTINIGGESYTLVKTINKRTINLKKINDVNEVSRRIASGRMDLWEADRRLSEINVETSKNPVPNILAAGLSSGFFAMLFGGGVVDFLIALAAGITIAYISSLFGEDDMFHFIISIVGGAVAAIYATVFHSIFGVGSIDRVIVGGITPLLPGLAMTNAIRDTMRGDLISGTARLMEALLKAVAIASGVGAILAVYAALGGGAAL